MREVRKLSKWLKPLDTPPPRTVNREQRIALRQAVEGEGWDRMQAIKAEMIASYRVPLPTKPAEFLSWAMSALVRDVLAEYENRVLTDAADAPTLEGDDE